jgi:hypothetical protein
VGTPTGLGHTLVAVAGTTLTTPFFDAFWPALAAGVGVLAIGYLAINWLLGLRDRAKSAQHTREAVLQIVLTELLHNAGEFTTWQEELPTLSIPFPGFQLEGWNLVSQMDALLTVGKETADMLVHAYNRMRSCNDQLAELRDLNSGRSALRVALTVASSAAPDGSNSPAIDAVVEEFTQNKLDLRDALLRRLEDLKPYLDDAIDAVGREIDIVESVPAARTIFRHTKPPDYVGERRP